MRADEDSISKIRAEIRNELSEAVLDARCPWRVIRRICPFSNDDASGPGHPSLPGNPAMGIE